MYIPDNIKDFFENLFTDKYTKQEKSDFLAKCESDGTLKQYIKKYHPKYYIVDRDMIMNINLAIDLRLCEI